MSRRPRIPCVAVALFFHAVLTRARIKGLLPEERKNDAEHNDDDKDI